MKKAINISLWSIFLIGIFVLLSFTEKNKNAKLCNKIEVTVDWEKGNQFVTKKNITTLINRMGYKENQSVMDSINIGVVEQKIRDLSSVDNVSVFKDMNGVLRVTIKQRKPIARILNRDGSSFYLDDQGGVMPTSTQFTARVVAVNGFINEKRTFSIKELKENDSLANTSQLDELYDFVTYYKQDKFFEAQIEQIYIERNGEYTIIPKVGDQKIIFGKPTDIERKLKNYKTWFVDGINPENLNLFEIINLKYNGQIVCTKK